MKPNRILSVILWLFVIFPCFSFPLSRDAKVSLITSDPGEALYATFGHSAIWIHDDSLGISYVYNYGTFDFDTPNFYLKFIRGKLPYKLSIAPFDRFYLSYQHEGRSLIEQQLNLTQKEKNAVFAYLQENYKPENRYYQYDFFFDNCATRIRDVFQDVLGEKLSFQKDRSDEATFRQLIDPYLKEFKWSDMGIDISLGLPCDEQADWKEQMFLPDYLYAAFGNATVDRAQPEPFVLKEQKILKNDPDPAVSSTNGPLILSFGLLLLALLLTWWGLRRKRAMAGFDLFWFSILGLIGWYVFFLWFLTDHEATKGNLNILWAIPVFFPLAFTAFRKSATRPWIRYCYLIILAINVLLLVSWPLLPQQYHVAFLGIILTSVLRSGYRVYYLNSIQTKFT